MPHLSTAIAKAAFSTSYHVLSPSRPSSSFTTRASGTRRSNSTSSSAPSVKSKSVPNYTRAEFEALSVQELKQIMRQHPGVLVGGRKEELVSRALVLAHQRYGTPVTERDVQLSRIQLDISPPATTIPTATEVATTTTSSIKAAAVHGGNHDGSGANAGPKMGNNGEGASHGMKGRDETGRPDLSQILSSHGTLTSQESAESLAAAARVENERLAKMQAEKARLEQQQQQAKEKAELDQRLAREKVEEQMRLAKEQAEKEETHRRTVQEKEKQEQLAKEKAVEQERHRRFEQERAQKERLIREKAEQERLAKEQVEKEEMAKEKAEQEHRRATMEKADKERAAKEQAEKKQLAREATIKEQAAEREQLVREQRAEKERIARAEQEAAAKAKAVEAASPLPATPTSQSSLSSTSNNNNNNNNTGGNQRDEWHSERLPLRTTLTSIGLGVAVIAWFLKGKRQRRLDAEGVHKAEEQELQQDTLEGMDEKAQEA